MRRTALSSAATAVAGLVLAVATPAAELSVGSGASLDLGTGSLDLGCADLSVAGTLSAGSVGLDAARNVAIAPSGVVNGDSAALELAGSWSNAGTFNAGTSEVRFVDGCGLTSATLSGDSSFASLAMSTSTGKTYFFEAGSTQEITDLLEMAGASGNRLRVRSTLDGSEAFLDRQGGMSMAFLDVKDNHAVANKILFGSHSLDSGNTNGWVFGSVPALPALALALLALTLLVAGRAALRRGGPPAAGASLPS